MRPHGKARVDANNPRAFAVCDRCQMWFNHVNLRWQVDFRGRNLQRTGLLVCARCFDTPQPQLKPRVLTPDPIAIRNPRIERYNERGTVVSVVGSAAGLSTVAAVGGIATVGQGQASGVSTLSVASVPLGVASAAGISAPDVAAGAQINASTVAAGSATVVGDSAAPGAMAAAGSSVVTAVGINPGAMAAAGTGTALAVGNPIVTVTTGGAATVAAVAVLPGDAAASGSSYAAAISPVTSLAVVGDAPIGASPVGGEES